MDPAAMIRRQMKASGGQYGVGASRTGGNSSAMDMYARMGGNMNTIVGMGGKGRGGKDQPLQTASGKTTIGPVSSDKLTALKQAAKEARNEATEARAEATAEAELLAQAREENDAAQQKNNHARAHLARVVAARIKAEMAEKLVRDEDELKRQLKEGREGSGEASPWTRVWPIRPKHDGTEPDPEPEPEMDPEPEQTKKEKSKRQRR